MALAVLKYREAIVFRKGVMGFNRRNALMLLKFLDGTFTRPGYRSGRLLAGLGTVYHADEWSARSRSGVRRTR